MTNKKWEPPHCVLPTQQPQDGVVADVRRACAAAQGEAGGGTNSMGPSEGTDTESSRAAMCPRTLKGPFTSGGNPRRESL